MRPISKVARPATSTRPWKDATRPKSADDDSRWNIGCSAPTTARRASGSGESEGSEEPAG